MSGILVVLVALALGSELGRRLARRGVTAANALVGRQVPAYVVLITVAGFGFLLYRAPRLAWMPTGFALYGEPAVLHAARALAACSVALLVVMEWPGRREPARRRRLWGGGSVLAALAGLLVFRALPLRVRAADSWIDNGVVRQTTAYTCAPASIATLVRWFGGDTSATEASVAGLAGTTREGTNTLRELAVMQRLGLGPRYGRFLTPDSLVAAGGPALLHVNEPVASGATVRHAVALLDLDPVARTVLVGNPLHGRQIKRFGELEGYWTGEAIFVTTRRGRGAGQ